jgi:hypothetical protein
VAVVSLFSVAGLGIETSLSFRYRGLFFLTCARGYAFCYRCLSGRLSIIW